MMKRKRIKSAALFSAILLLTCTFCTNMEQTSNNVNGKLGSNKRWDRQKSVEEIKKGVDESRRVLVAKVNGADITMYSLVREMNAVAPTFIPDGVPSSPEITLKIKKKALNNLIFRELAVQEAVKQGITVEPQELDRVLENVKARTGSEAAYKKYLEDSKVDEATLIELIRKDHLFETITSRELFDKITVTEKEIRNKYLKERASYLTRDNPPRQMTFEEAKDSITKRIKAEKSEKVMIRWEKKLREKAKIEIADTQF